MWALFMENGEHTSMQFIAILLSNKPRFPASASAPELLQEITIGQVFCPSVLSIFQDMAVNK